MNPPCPGAPPSPFPPPPSTSSTARRNCVSYSRGNGRSAALIRNPGRLAAPASSTTPGAARSITFTIGRNPSPFPPPPSPFPVVPVCHLRHDALRLHASGEIGLEHRSNGRGCERGHCRSRTALGTE